MVVGTWGFVVNTTVLIVGVRFGLKPSVAGPVGAQLAVISNFLLNNIWTFSDRQITSWEVIPGKFLQFNVFSLGALLIQFSFLRVGERIFGLRAFKRPFIELSFFSRLPLFPVIIRLPIIDRVAAKFSLYLVVYMMAVGVGMVVNFLIYSYVIWREK